MEEIVHFPELQGKLMQLPSQSRKNFIDILHKVYEDESRDMVDMLGKSRTEIQDMAEFIQKEQKALKETLQELKSQRISSERDAESRMSTVSCTDGVVNGGRKKKRKNRSGDTAGSRPISARSLPTAMNTHVTIEEEKETVFRNLNSAGAKLDEERRRQAARVEELKEMKMQKQTDNASKARELMGEAENLTKMLDKSKVQHQEKVMEKVHERKQKKGENTPEIQTIHVEPACDAATAGGGGNGHSPNAWNTEMHI